ncbi:hypothetical protein MML48_6g00006370 [Holotrichia oblita]|uniref:Uncharacterized protein n=1 Tax=Holotrichia oblita TaxID=644536 RepID=A0ACB9T0K1_HOLOL|nr:hypothetical protein MML48_6g00006370 [Holotrichia oblita]
MSTLQPPNRYRACMLPSQGVQEITDIPDDYLNQSSVLKHLAKEVKIPNNNTTARDNIDNQDDGHFKELKYAITIRDRRPRISQMGEEQGEIRRGELEQEVLKVHRAHEELVQTCDRRERLEKAARVRLQNENPTVAGSESNSKGANRFLPQSSVIEECLPARGPVCHCAAKRKIPKPLLAGVSTDSGGLFDSGSSFLLPSQVARHESGDMLLLEKQGRTSQKQRMQENNTPTNGQQSNQSDSPTATNSDLPPSSLPRPPRTSSTHRSGLPRRMGDYNRLPDAETPPQRKKSDGGDSSVRTRVADVVRRLDLSYHHRGNWANMGDYPRAEDPVRR